MHTITHDRIQVGDHAIWTDLVGHEIPVRVLYRDHPSAVYSTPFDGRPELVTVEVLDDLTVAGLSHPVRRAGERHFVCSTYLAGPVLSTDPTELAGHLRCSDCTDDQALTYQGQFGPRGDRFARYECPRCQTSWPERSPVITRQISKLRHTPPPARHTEPERHHAMNRATATLTVLVALSGGALVACGGDDVEPATEVSSTRVSLEPVPTTTGAPAPTMPPVTAKTKDLTAHGDVTIGAVAEQYGMVMIPVAVTNRSSKTSDYSITIGATSPDGTTKYDDCFAGVQRLEPGQATTLEAFCGPKVPATATFELAEVARWATNS